MPRKSTNQQSNKDQDESKETTFDIISPKNWDISNHVCGPAKLNKNGQGKSAQITYRTRRFYLKTPKMFCPFGAGKPKPKAGDKEKETDQWSLQMVFGPEDKECQVFQEKAKQFDQFMIDEGVKPENNVGWLGSSKSKLFSREVVESKYKPLVKFSMKDGEVLTQYPPFIRAAFPTDYKEPHDFNCEFYDKDNEMMTVSTSASNADSITKKIPPGSFCSALLSGSIWCTGGGYGVSWKVQQIKVFPAKGTLPKGKCLVDDPEDDEEVEEEEAPVKPQSKAPEKEKEKVVAKDEDEDEEEEGDEEIDEEGDEEIIEEEAEIIAPAPAPVVVPIDAKKKPVNKK
jgi:hypothetical protein